MTFRAEKSAKKFSFFTYFTFILLATAITIYIKSRNKNVNLISASIMLILFPLSFFIGKYLKEKFVINTIHFEGDQLFFQGIDNKKPFSKVLDIKNASIKIKSIGGRTNVDYILKVTAPEGSFEINKSLNWEYDSLVGVFEEFKKRKNEKVIFDEQYFLDIMKKKAQKIKVK